VLNVISLHGHDLSDSEKSPGVSQHRCESSDRVQREGYCTEQNAAMSVFLSSFGLLDRQDRRDSVC
jgi:hypothetical protein